jgi:hypothetical protein
MKAFLAAIIFSVAVAGAAYAVLGTLQKPADQAFSAPSSVRL